MAQVTLHVLTLFSAETEKQFIVAVARSCAGSTQQAGSFPVAAVHDKKLGAAPGSERFVQNKNKDAPRFLEKGNEPAP